MLEAHQIEELISLVSSMSRDVVEEHLLTFEGSFPVDFTPDFLDRLPTERLRHIYVALCIHNSQLPHEALAA